MFFLAIDTTDNFCRVALYDSASGYFVGHSVRCDYGHSEQLLPQIRDLLIGSSVNRDDLGAIAVLCGAGSFTGIRVGLATARGLALALGLKLVGLGNFELWRRQLSQSEVLPDGSYLLSVLESKRRDFYCHISRYGSGGSGGSGGFGDIMEPSCCYIDAIDNFLADKGSVYVVGTGVERLLVETSHVDKLEVISVGLPSLRVLCSESAGILGAGLEADYPAEPSYLKPPSVTTKKELKNK